MCEVIFKVKNVFKRYSLVYSELKFYKRWCGVGFKRLINLRRYMLRIYGSIDGLLFSVKRVKFLDLNKKVFVLRIDFVEYFVLDFFVVDINIYVVFFN